MKKTQKILSAALSAALVLSAMAVPTFADEAETAPATTETGGTTIVKGEGEGGAEGGSSEEIPVAETKAAQIGDEKYDTVKALLETDGNGRFTSVRFEDDSVTYTLNVETVTDDDAYKDAMNQYNYENAQYDKMVQDINVKTSLIQQEDQQLELRLKQLDTEQNALSTEIDAVSKVVKDNIEDSFKTFGG